MTEDAIALIFAALVTIAGFAALWKIAYHEGFKAGEKEK